MKHCLILSGSILLIGALLLALTPGSVTKAMPEYSAQTGEPCASCHTSPSGGGPRGPRGQAWVASNKPQTVPGLVESLELLGVELAVDPAYYLAADSPIPEADSLDTAKQQGLLLYRLLGDFDGN